LKFNTATPGRDGFAMKEYIDLIYACEDHIDLAIDDFLVENETFPVLTKADKATCSYCENVAEYVLNKSELNKD